ncbi:MAG: 1-phosphofructokinase family hexose kinase [Microbacterium sp.]
MIVTVTPNPALDMTWHVERITPGESHRVDTGRTRAGGKGINVARVAHAQGAEAVAVTTAGGATGEEFYTELKASGVPHRLVPVAAPTRRSVALVDASLGDTTILNERGSALTDDEWAHLTTAIGLDGDVLVVSGSLPPGTPDDFIPRLVSGDRPVIVDTSGPALLRAAEAGAWLVKPNRDELAEATGLSDPVTGARELLRMGAGTVLVSLGADGMLAVTADALLHAQLPEALAGNPTGAGDAAVAAVAVLRDAGIIDLTTLLRRAVAWSAAAVLMPLAGDIHPTWPDLEARVTITDREHE